MNGGGGRSPDEAARALTALFARMTAQPLSHERIALDALPDRVTAKLVAGPPRRSPLLLALALAVPAAIALLVWRLYPDPPITYVVTGGVQKPGAVEARPGGAATIAFSEGSTFVLGERSAFRVATASSRGARVVVERGRAAARVVPRPGARWAVAAGPFEILVTGTAFDVDWADGRGVLSVQMKSGSVIVRGPLAGEGIRLAAGQRLSINLAARRVSLDAAPPWTAGLSPAPEPRPSSVEPARVVPPRGVRPRTPRAEPDLAVAWSRALGRGDFAAVVAAAEARGLPQAYTGASRPALVALADAARYLRRHDVAQGALEAIRSRFPAARDAAEAAFFLGWIAEERGAPAEAVGWYDRYRLEAPEGAYAEKALGRKMLLRAKASRPAAARLADEYLARYPGGAYAAPARKLAAP